MADKADRANDIDELADSEREEEALVEQWLQAEGTEPGAHVAQVADEPDTSKGDGANEVLVADFPNKTKGTGVDEVQVLDDGGLPEDADGSEKVFDLPGSLADATTADVDAEALEGIEDIEDPQEKLEAYREAGYPEALLEVVSDHHGRVVKVTPLAGER